MIQLIFGLLLQVLRLSDGLWKRRNYLQHLKDQIDTSRSITHELNRFIVGQDVERIVLLRANNGTGLPRYGRPHYVSVVDYVTRGAYTGDANRWREIMIDQWYRESLVKSAADGCLIVNTADIPDSALKQLYEENRVIRSVWLPILELPKEYWFVAVHITDKQDIHRRTERIIAARQHLQSIISQRLRKVTL